MIAISGNCMLRRAKRSKNEVVAPEEEEELCSVVLLNCLIAIFRLLKATKTCLDGHLFARTVLCDVKQFAACFGSLWSTHLYFKDEKSVKRFPMKCSPISESVLLFGRFPGFCLFAFLVRATSRWSNGGKILTGETKETKIPCFSWNPKPHCPSPAYITR
jgi:hypothetical protein